MGPFMFIPMLPFAWAGGGGSPCPSCGGPTNDGGPLANRVCGRFFVAFGLLDANTRSAKHGSQKIRKPRFAIYKLVPVQKCRQLTIKDSPTPDLQTASFSSNGIKQS